MVFVKSSRTTKFYAMRLTRPKGQVHLGGKAMVSLRAVLCHKGARRFGTMALATDWTDDSTGTSTPRYLA
jgi:hypothetical protein